MKRKEIRETFRMSASQWRSAGYLKDHKIRKTNSKEGQSIDKIRKDFVFSSYYIDSVTQNQIWRINELYHNNHQEHPEGKHILDICVPVKPL